MKALPMQLMKESSVLMLSRFCGTEGETLKNDTYVIWLSFPASRNIFLLCG